MLKRVFVSLIAYCVLVSGVPASAVDFTSIAGPDAILGKILCVLELTFVISLINSIDVEWRTLFAS
ncbi:MAG: hypothetical protein R2827_14865 [Bdellovibrionales bacterium]